MKKNIVLGLTISVMLMGMIGVVTAPAFAIDKPHNSAQFANKFDPSTVPEKGTEYVLTISGKSELASLAGGFTKHAQNKMRAVPANLPFELSPGHGIPMFSGVAVRPQLAVPISGEVTIKVADFYVSTGKSSSHSSPKSILVNPNAVVFIVESGNVKIGDGTYTVDNGVALYYKEFSLSIGSGSDLVLNVEGALSGGIPITQQTLGSITNMHSSLKVGGDNWTFDGGISMAKLT